MTIKDLEPKSVWTNFYDFSQVPRPSKHEEKAQEFLLEWGKKAGYSGIGEQKGCHPSGAHGHGASEDGRNSA